uniref:Steroidogenic acute regulatory protein, mitochondrial n=1 Tax=Accipiter nisus TaxID=211598 RepID=A0A8B9MMP2_9AVES
MLLTARFSTPSHSPNPRGHQLRGGNEGVRAETLGQQNPLLQLRSHFYTCSRVRRRSRGGAGDEFSRCSAFRFSSMDLSYITQGETALQRALSILQQHTSWQAETMLDTGATVSSAALPGLGKVFRAEVVLAVPVARLHRELFERIEQMPQWNPTLSRVKVLQRVGTDTLVTHEVTAPSPGNLVGQRDFVSVRHRGRRETAVYLVGTATHVEPLPLQEGCIRAESRLSCIVLQPLAGDPDRTRFTWLLSMDLKGWIPTSVINRVLPQSQADFIEHLRRHLSAAACP